MLIEPGIHFTQRGVSPIRQWASKDAEGQALLHHALSLPAWATGASGNASWDPVQTVELCRPQRETAHEETVQTGRDQDKQDIAQQTNIHQ